MVLIILKQNTKNIEVARLEAKVSLDTLNGHVHHVGLVFHERGNSDGLRVFVRKKVSVKIKDFI
jgi:hypothetical protein